ncbi:MULTISPECIES: hypothetical protein [unclassified Algibacter]|uniref:hypothetical protein n=1 Tax=unclassified Algibacter TaxID=2615009 RepID=UPI00131A9E3A|nr:MULTISPECIES: hypothetical protein [unclassified Algibacter]MCL5128386.1 hypothetical protein [Algibacter sp. L4_22]
MENDTTLEIELKSLDAVPTDKTQEMLSLYVVSLGMETYAKLCFAVIFILILVHNIFIAGNSYELDTYDTIMAVELSIVGVIILAVFIIAGIAMSKLSQLKNLIIENSKRNNLKKQELGEEFSFLAVHLYGGRGITIK